MSDALDTLMRSARRRSTLVASLGAASHGLAVGAAALLAVALWHRFVAPAPALLAAVVLAMPRAVALAASWRNLPAPLALAGAIDHCDLLARGERLGDARARRRRRASCSRRDCACPRALQPLWPMRLPGTPP
jgi:hypothetical protein